MCVCVCQVIYFICMGVSVCQVINFSCVGVSVSVCQVIYIYFYLRN